MQDINNQLSEDNFPDSEKLNKIKEELSTYIIDNYETIIDKILDDYKKYISYINNSLNTLKDLKKETLINPEKKNNFNVYANKLIEEINSKKGVKECCEEAYLQNLNNKIDSLVKENEIKDSDKITQELFNTAEETFDSVPTPHLTWDVEFEMITEGFMDEEYVLPFDSLLDYYNLIAPHIFSKEDTIFIKTMDEENSKEKVKFINSLKDYIKSDKEELDISNKYYNEYKNSKVKNQEQKLKTKKIIKDIKTFSEVLSKSINQPVAENHNETNSPLIIPKHSIPSGENILNNTKDHNR